MPTDSAASILRATARYVLAQSPTEPILPTQAWETETTIIVTTFERPRCVQRLLASIRRFFSHVPILVCETSREPLFANDTRLPANIVWLTLPFAQGHTLGAARNHLVGQTTTSYFFLCDDDQLFTSQTNLQKLHDFLSAFRYDLVGGAQGPGKYGTAIFEQKGATVYQHFYRHHGLIAPRVVRCERVSNSFLARTEAVRQVGWEDRVYASEHAEFFWRASRQPLKIAQMGGVSVNHERQCELATGIMGWLLGRWLPHRDRSYHRWRQGGSARRAQELERRYCLEKNGLQAIINVHHHADKWRLQELLG